MSRTGIFRNVNYVFVNSPSDLPEAVSNIHTLLPNVTYFFTKVVDLLGARIVCSENTCIIGGSSENCRIKST